MAQRSSKKAATAVANRDWLWGAVLVLAVFLAYTPMFWAGYIWDDVRVVATNPVIVGPLGLKEIWTTQAADICPLTLTTFWAGYHLWGLDPLPFHLLNVALHAASAVLLWQVLRLLRIPGAWLGAAMWALHPVEVESVAWITELKNTQSGFFYLLTIFFFVRSLVSNAASRRDYSLALLCAVLAMASKSSTVVLPLVLCLCAWWMEGRWHVRNLMKLSPMFVMALLAGVLSMWTQKTRLDALGDPAQAQPWLERLAAAGDAVWFYLGKLVWPQPLVTFYPHWQIDIANPLSWLPTLAVIFVIVVLWMYRQTWGRPLFFAFAYFLAALLPVLGFFYNTIFSYAPVFDHLQYLASMGPLALAGAGVVQLGAFLGDQKKWQVPALATGLLLLLGVTTWRQGWVYQSEETLWKNTLDWYPGNTVAHYSLGTFLAREKRSAEAIAEFRMVVNAMPDNPMVRNNLGRVLADSGQVDEAIEQLQLALKRLPDQPAFHANLGKAYLQKGNVDDAVAELRKAIALKDDDLESHYSLGVALAKKGDIDAAIAEFRRAVEIDPNDADSHNNLGVELLQKGDAAKAIWQFDDALRLNPDDASAQANRAKAEGMAGATK